jgi:hemerythrin-like domain-containing protein
MPVAFPFPDNIAERPLELLYACHDKVRHFVAVIDKLAPHVAAHGTDAEAQEAAANALRYFEQAMPLHHIDEEEDVFPALRALQDEDVDAAIESVQNEHLTLDRLWKSIRGWLKQIADGQLPPHEPGTLAQFVRAYPAHAAREEKEIFAALERLSEDELMRIGRRMRERRGAYA